MAGKLWKVGSEKIKCLGRAGKSGRSGKGFERLEMFGEKELDLEGGLTRM